MNRSGPIVIGLILNLCLNGASAETVVVISAKSPVTVLSKNQIADIFLGKASRFPNGELAVPIDQADGSTIRNDFYEKFTGKSPAQLKAHWSKMNFTGRGRPPPAVSDSRAVKLSIIGNPQSIGYIDDREADAGVKIIRPE